MKPNPELAKLSGPQKSQLFDIFLQMGADPVAKMQALRVPVIGRDKFCWDCGKYWKRRWFRMRPGCECGRAPKPPEAT